ncbi:MAG TPA: hypothetical protein VFK45_03330 [Gammaproteobacteria bacterium]|nr:hypothetical protein [Gammaproteobacteria bacterium]
MKLASFEAIVRALNNADVRYLIAGGLAVNAHGYLRYTKDVDLVVDLEEANTLRALKALESLGFKPTIPVEATQFADAETRNRWVQEKHMKVMQLFSDQHRETPVDIFVSAPFDFEAEHEAAYTDEAAPGLMVRFVRLETLIQMKEEVGRDRDKDDVQHLRWLQEEEKGDEPDGR